MEPFRTIQPGESVAQYLNRHKEYQQATRNAQAEANRKAANLRRRLQANEGRYVFAERPRCPRCNSVELKVYRSDRDGEAISRHELCKSCEFKFILILE